MVNRRARIAVGASVFTALIAFAVPSSAAESLQKQCGDEWAAAKKAGTVPAGQAWPGFLSECKKRKAAGGPTVPATPAAATATPTVADKKAERKEKAAEKKAEKAEEKKEKAAEKKADKAAPAAAPATAKETKTEIVDTCKSEYNAGKASGAVPKGTNYFKYLSECKKRHAGDTAPAPTAAAPAPAPTAAAPAPAPTAAAPAEPAPATTKSGKPVSPGREAFIERERTCGAKWKTIKGTTALPAGITTWPKYLSYCNARLKANQPI